MENGFLKIHLGPMFSGKSTELIRLANKYKTINKKILIINHSIDVRSGKNNIKTHDKVTTECISLEHLTTLFDCDDYKESEIIFIEEAQFFDDLYNFVKKSVDEDLKTIYIFGLDGDFKREPFGNSDLLRLIPIADEVIKFNALCKLCSPEMVEAPFSIRLQNGEKNNSQQLIGGGDLYVASCRKHYLQYNK